MSALGRATRLPPCHPQVLCERCAELCNGAMIPAVEDFTQRLLAQQQAQLSTSGPSSSFSPSEDQELQIELLGKALISPEQLRAQLMVRVMISEAERRDTRPHQGPGVTRGSDCPLSITVSSPRLIPKGQAAFMIWACKGTSIESHSPYRPLPFACFSSISHRKFETRRPSSS